MKVESGRASEALIDEAYYQAILQKPLHPVYQIAEPHLPTTGIAVDLGCGVGNATLFLLGKGLEVFAVDISRQALDILETRAGQNSKLHVAREDMKSWSIPECDVVSAGFSLFFLDQPGLESAWPRIVAALKPGGLFIGQFLGVHDEWRDQGHALVDDRTLGNKLSEFDLIHYEEVDREGENVHGRPKHWHVFHVVAKKK